MKWTQNGGLRRARGFAIIDGIHQHGHTQHIRQQYEFLSPIIAHMACCGQELNGLKPFLLGRLNLFHRCMQVTDQNCHDLFKPRIGGVGDAPCDNIGRVFFGKVSSFHILSYRAKIAFITRASSDFGSSLNSSARHAT